MGGMGSGNRVQYGGSTTEDYHAVDIRWLKRNGILEPGTRRSINWSRGGERTGSIQIRAELNRVYFIYKHRSYGDDWKDECYPVEIELTPCHMGGGRPWFRCPAKGCGRRVAVLYGGAIFACRHCHQLVYPSQRERPGDRAARKADRIRDKLGWEAGILNGSEPWNKPKGMHWATYHRLCREHDDLSQKALAGILEHLEGFSGLR